MQDPWVRTLSTLGHPGFNLTHSHFSSYLCLVALGFCWHVGFLSCESGGYSLVWVLGASHWQWASSLLWVRALGCTGFSRCGSRVIQHRLSAVAHSLRCSATCRIGPQSGTESKVPCIGRWILYHSATREALFPHSIHFSLIIFK